MKLPEISINPKSIRTIDQAKDAISELLNTIEELGKTIRQLSERNAALEKELARYKKQAKKPQFPASNNASAGNNDYSSKKQLNESTGWHKPDKKPNISPDREEQLSEVDTCSCGSTLFTVIRTWNKLVQGLIIKRENVLYNGRDKKCQNCGKVYGSIIPKDIFGKEFSSELRTWVSIFKFDLRLSERLIKRFCEELEISISKGQITAILLENSQKLSTSFTYLKIWGLKLSSFVHTDATMINRFLKTGKRLHEHVNFIGHKFLSLFIITPKYNGAVLTAKVFTKRALQKIIVISDDASANGKWLLLSLKQLCWIHEIRHYLKLEPSVLVHKRKLATVTGQLWTWYHKAKDYGRDPTPQKRKALEDELDKIVSQRTGYKELDHRLFLTQKKKKRLLLFLDYPGLPIENNLAERGLRPVVILRKLMGGTKSPEGDRSFERHMSIIHTAKKQGLNMFETMHGLINGTLDPSILTKKTLRALIAC